MKTGKKRQLFSELNPNYIQTEKRILDLFVY